MNTALASFAQPVIRPFERTDYAACYAAMRRYTAERDEASADELWLVEHPPVFTLGQAGRPEHLLRATDIPVIHVDRGGQITYHGPGQVVIYLLLDLRRRELTIKPLVQLLEQSVIDLLDELGLRGERRAGAPGVYVGEAKIAALGLRVRNGCCYHGLALNVDMDLAPFAQINPCGYEGLRVTQLADLGVALPPGEVAERLASHIKSLLDAPAKLTPSPAEPQR